MKKDRLIKLIENMDMEEIQQVEIMYITEKGIGMYGYGREDDKIETLKINKE